MTRLGSDMLRLHFYTVHVEYCLIIVMIFGSTSVISNIGSVSVDGALQSAFYYPSSRVRLLFYLTPCHKPIAIEIQFISDINHMSEHYYVQVLVDAPRAGSRG